MLILRLGNLGLTNPLLCILNDSSLMNEEKPNVTEDAACYGSDDFSWEL